MKKKWMVILSLLLLTVTGAIASTPTPPSMEVNRATQLELIDALVAQFNAHYVFPDKAKQAEAVLRQRQHEGKYDGITDANQLAKQLTDDLDGVVHDKHLLVAFSARPVPLDDAVPPPPTTRAEWEQRVPPEVLKRVMASKLGLEKIEHMSP